jgi:Fe-S-cluster-containing dehydrogenase component
MSHAFYLDVDRCTGCFACAVACMDQNDLEVGGEPTAWRQVFKVERARAPTPVCATSRSPACTARMRLA